MIYIYVFILLLILELSYFKLASRFKIVAKPNGRSSHKKLTVVGGGIIFYFSILLYCIINGFEYPWFFVSLTILTIVSFIDDFKPQSFRIRLLVQIIAVILLFYELGILETCWLYIIIGLVLSTGILNAYNFMDGINGMIGLTSFVVLASLLYIDYYIIDFIKAEIIFYVLLGLVIFNFFNVRRQPKCFAGDVGAISLAFIILFMLAKLIMETENFVWIGLLSVFGVEVVLTIAHRIILKENIAVAHRKHLFQLLVNEVKIPHIWVSSIYAVVQLFISIGLIALKGTYAIVFFIVTLLLLAACYYYFKKKYFPLHKLNVLETQQKAFEKMNI